ncbi:MAG: HupE/UreJ family protein [Rhodospirillales bacterium]|nr:MAG: HupE/UreJ family protein [Rhodospirillales bacterium]
MMRSASRFVLALMAMLVGVIGSAPSSIGHALQPGYLEIRPIDADIYTVTWKTPAVAGRPMAIAARLPDSCEPRLPVQPVWDGAAYLARWTATCPGGLVGGTIAIEGLPATQTDVLVRIVRDDGTEQTARLTPSATEFVIEATPRALDVASTYLVLGIEHILLGVDHLLFVLALLILVSGWRRLVWTITAFTAAHSITLAGATLGLVQVSQGPVEAIIALSILFVAMEIVHTRQGRPGLTERRPWIVAFAFGLLHGFGFAGALAEVGLPENAIPLALLFFNIGVEIGQLLFVAAVLGVIAGWRRLDAPWPAWAWRIPVYVIGSLAAHWTIERVANLIVI